MLGSWSPDSAPSNIDSQVLIKIGQLDNPADIEPKSLFSQDEISQIASWLKLDNSQWQSACQSLSDEQKLNLVIFFTASEDKEASWQSGSNNPAIAILKQMKAAGSYPEKDFIKALKKMTTNRFIPYGSAL